MLAWEVSRVILIQHEHTLGRKPISKCLWNERLTVAAVLTLFRD